MLLSGIGEPRLGGLTIDSQLSDGDDFVAVVWGKWTALTDGLVRVDP